MCARVQRINFLTHKSFTFLYFFSGTAEKLTLHPPTWGVKPFFNCAMKGKDEVKKRENSC